MKITAMTLLMAFTIGAWDLGLGTWNATLHAQESEAWRSVAEAIPLGTKVRVQTIEGRRFSGTLMRVDAKALLVKKNTRHPEPAVSVAFDAVAKLERQKEGGINIGKAVAVGAATGAGAMLTIILFALQLD